MLIQNKRIVGIVLTVALLLLVPLVAMQFTPEVNWTLSDFVVMGVLLLGTGLTGELIIRNVRKVQHRLILGAIVLAVFFLIWIELAVGIFGTPFAGS